MLISSFPCSPLEWYKITVIINTVITIMITAIKITKLTRNINNVRGNINTMEGVILI